jgi:hypothetical protein
MLAVEYKFGLTESEALGISLGEISGRAGLFGESVFPRFRPTRIKKANPA